MTDKAEFTLSERPELVQAVGGLIMSVSQIEALLFPVTALLLGQPLRVAAAILEHIDNVSARLAIVFDLAALNPSKPIAAVVVGEKERILKALAMRNRIAHSVFGYDEETEEVLLMSNYLTAKRGNPQKSPITAEDILEHARNLSNASGLIGVFLGEVDMTPHHRMKDSSKASAAQKRRS